MHTRSTIAMSYHSYAWETRLSRLIMSWSEKLNTNTQSGLALDVVGWIRQNRAQ